MDRDKLHPSLQNAEFTLDDIGFPPRKIPGFEWKDVDLTTHLTKRIVLKMPILSAPMDRVTGHKMAILMATLGGIGAIHFNFPTINEQMDEVEKVRRFEAGFVRKPKVLSKECSVGDVFGHAQQDGFFSYPITEDGTPDTPMVGIVTRRDVRYREDLETNIQGVMTPRKKLIVAHRKDTLDRDDIRTANAIIRAHNLDTLPIVDDEFKVVALVTDSDLTKNSEFPLATKDGNNQLKVLVAVESRLDHVKERIWRAKDAGACGVVVDSRNIFRDHLEIAKWVKRDVPDLDVIIGNVVSGEVIRAVMDEAGGCVDAFRVGIGGGETCITSETLGLGRPLGSALYDVDQNLRPYMEKFGHIGIIADGGIKLFPLHIVGAMMLGASTVMMGTELAGFKESPLEPEWDYETNQLVKHTRGMGSKEVIRERAGGERYMVGQNLVTERFPEGKEVKVPYKGPGGIHLKQLLTGVRQALHGLGATNFEELYKDGYINPIRKASSKGFY